MTEKTLKLGKAKGNYISLTIKERTGKHWETFEQVKGYAISISGAVRVPYTECWGQCQDSIKELFEEGIFKNDKEKVYRIIELWNEWHLNDLNAGTKKQTEYLKKIGVEEYKEAVEKLKEVGLYEDNGYRYGSAWLFNPASDEIVKELEELFS